LTGPRRTSYDIIGEILDVARKGAFKTHIMYKVKMSYYQLEKYLSMLVEKGFLRNTEVKPLKCGRARTVYRTTLEGIGLLDRLESLENHLAKTRRVRDKERGQLVLQRFTR
jgi:predicted transcriptional regulator